MDRSHLEVPSAGEAYVHPSVELFSTPEMDLARRKAWARSLFPIEDPFSHILLRVKRADDPFLDWPLEEK